MKITKLERRPLNADDLIFKEAYINRTRDLWHTPMTFAQYQQYVAEGTAVSTPSSHIFIDRSKDGRGNTISEIDQANHVDIAIHGRYSYPILHNHEYIEIIYIATGQCLNLFEDFSLPMKQGDVCIMSPNAYHAISCTDDESCIVNIMVSKKFFDRNFLQALSGGRIISDFLGNILYQQASNPYILFPTGSDPWLYELAVKMITESEQHKRAYDYAISLLASAFLFHLTREYEIMAIVPNKQNSMPNELIVSILGYLSVNYRQATLANTAHFFGYSQSYLSRTIHEHTGKTYNQLIAQLQMERAKELLESGGMSLAQIAQEVGCFDSSHFTKKFKTAYGMSPKKYQLTCCNTDILKNT